MNTLITAGCSYSDAAYPCWNMWLGQHYDNHLSLALAGTGPKYSYIRIRDYFKYEKNINPKEHHVIVQWSSLLRHDFRMNPKTWYAGGQITNNDVFSDDYVDKYFRLTDTTCDLLYYIESLISLSKELGFKLHMLYMFEPWVDDFFGEPTYIPVEKVDKDIDVWKSSEYLESLKEYYESDYFIPLSIEGFCIDNVRKKDFYNFGHGHYNTKELMTNSIDYHPSPLQHFKYFEFLSSYLKVGSTPKEWLGVANQLEEIVTDLKLYPVFMRTFFDLTSNRSIAYTKDLPHYRGLNEKHNVDLINKCLLEYKKRLSITKSIKL